jgi:hypothetical protein
MEFKPNNFNMRQSFSENYYFFLQPFEVKQDFSFFSLGNTAKTFVGHIFDSINNQFYAKHRTETNPAQSYILNMIFFAQKSKRHVTVKKINVTDILVNLTGLIKVVHIIFSFLACITNSRLYLNSLAKDLFHDEMKDKKFGWFDDT